jgi:hypothetical protein
MTSEERRNESLKLVANWANTIATAIMTAGTFVPAAQFIYGILPQNRGLWLRRHLHRGRDTHTFRRTVVPARS